MGELAPLRLALFTAVLFLPAGLAAQQDAWIGWDLRCETGRIPIGSDEWSWTRIRGLTPVTEDGRQLARLEDGASLLLLLRADDEPRTLHLEARGGRGAARLAAVLNGVELGEQRLGRGWKVLGYSIPAGTLVHGPNVLNLELVAKHRGAEVSGPVFIDRVAVEPVAECKAGAPVAVDPAADNTLPPDSAIVVPGRWSAPSRLAVRIATRWPRTSLSTFCIGDRSAHLASALAGSRSLRAASTVALSGDCATGWGLVAVADGPGPVTLRKLALGPRALPWSRLLGAPFVGGLALVALGLLAASALLRRSALGTRPGRLAATILGGGDLAMRAVKSPGLWLVLVLWLAFLAARNGGELTPQRVNDTADYEELLGMGASGEVMGHHRTAGYPLVLRLAGWEQWGIQRVPVAHALFYGAGILVFWLGVRVYTTSGWLAFCAAAPLVASPLLRVVSRVQPDFMGGVASLVVLGLLLLLAAPPARSRWLWVALAAAIFAGYQTRPALVFLIGFVPLAAAVAWAAKHGARDPRLRRFVTVSLIAAIGPFLLYSTVRWLRVGHFGLVSYGGFQVIGIASPMLDEELTASLPADARPLAEAILQEKRRRGLLVYQAGSPLDYWYRNYNTHVWSIAVPVARRLYESDPAHSGGLVDVNARFTALALAIVVRRPALYLDWLVRTFAETSGRALREPWVKWPLVSLAIAGALYFARRRRLPPPRPLDRLRLRAVAGLTLVAGGYYLVQLLLVVSVEVPLERYYVAAVFLIPCALCALVFETARLALPASTRS